MKNFARFILCSLSAFLLTTQLFASDAISLLSTMNVPMSKYGMTWQSPQVRLRIKNLAYDKSVRVYFVDSAGQTTVSQASYVGPADAGYEVWESFGNVSGGGAASFYAEYMVGSEVYRLDDQGQNIELKRGPILHAGQSIQQVLSAKAFYGNYASFVVAVRNLAYHKNVVAHYSCNDFQSEDSIALSFQSYFPYGYGYIQSPTPEGFEMWSSRSIQVAESCSTLRFYFSYDVDGQHYADTNFGHNYVMFRN